MDTEAIVNEIIKLRRNDSTLLVGLDGLGGAGKSTAAEDIKRRIEDHNISTEIFHIDDFIHPKVIRYNDEYPQWEQYYYLQWRCDYYIGSIVKPAREGRELPPVELYDKDNDSYLVRQYHIPKGSVIITEGIFLQREELRECFDLMIYIDVPENERLKRVLLRDGYIGDETAIREKYESRYFPAEHYYAEKYRPAESADIVIGADC